MKKEVVIFPKEVFETAESKEELEDYLMVQNAEFIKRMRKARQDDVRNKGKDWEKIKEELCLE